MSVYVGQRDVVLVSGADAASYLQGQISQDVDAIAVGSSANSLILQPQGKIDAWFRITRVGDGEFALDVDAGWGDVLMARLKRFMLRVKVELALESWHFHAYRGETPAALDAPIVAVVDNGVDVLAPELVPPTADLMSDEQYAAMRISAGRPAMGSELSEDTIPAAAGIVNESASFTKGCYTGQELVARVDSRGNNTPVQLRRFAGDGAVPSVGDAVAVDGADVATLTSVAPTDSGWLALGYLKRSAADASTAVMADGSIVGIERVGDFV
ncbi:MAG: folate-binding protein YgfZ [Acidimicrobiales bacterium]|nr:folate-binding protein YgfZ [Acidimicrobiales bacterium]